MLSLISAVALAAATASVPTPRIRAHGVQPTILRAALRAPESPRVTGQGPRYCVVDDVFEQSGRRVCRTRKQWAALGVDPIVG